MVLVEVMVLVDSEAADKLTNQHQLKLGLNYPMANSPSASPSTSTIGQPYTYDTVTPKVASDLNANNAFKLDATISVTVWLTVNKYHHLNRMLPLQLPYDWPSTSTVIGTSDAEFGISFSLGKGKALPVPSSASPVLYPCIKRTIFM